jgi:uncharacterized membrane protein YdbT with pleckstrin-like domain
MISWIVGAFIVLLGLLGLQTTRVGTAKKKVKEKEGVIDSLQAREAEQAKVSKAADEKKDALATKAKESAEEKAVTLAEVDALPKETEHVLSDATKELAKKQVTRTRTHSVRLDADGLPIAKKPRATTKTDNS